MRSAARCSGPADPPHSVVPGSQTVKWGEMSRMSRWCGNVTLAGLDTTEASRFSIIAFKITIMLQTPIHLSSNILRILQSVISTSWTETVPNIAEGGFLEHLDGRRKCRVKLEQLPPQVTGELLSVFFRWRGGSKSECLKIFLYVLTQNIYVEHTRVAASRGGWRRLANESLAVCRLIRTSGSMLHAAIKQAED